MLAQRCSNAPGPCTRPMPARPALRCVRVKVGRTGLLTTTGVVRMTKAVDSVLSQQPVTVLEVPGLLAVNQRPATTWDVPSQAFFVNAQTHDLYLCLHFV